MEKYVVLKRFRDRTDKLRTYENGEEYPHKDAPFPSSSRQKGLISMGYIEKKEEEKDGKKL